MMVQANDYNGADLCQMVFFVEILSCIKNVLDCGRSRLYQSSIAPSLYQQYYEI